MHKSKTAGLLSVVATLTILIGACGGSDGGKKEVSAVSAAPASAGASPAVSPTTTASPTRGTAKSSARASATAPVEAITPSTTLPNGHVAAMPASFTVSVDKPCTHAEDTQGFTVHGGMPGQLLIYDTAYADGTDDYTSHYGTGSGHDKFDANGDFRTTFVLAGKVPPGTAYLSVGSAQGSQLIQTRTTFLIKRLTESCP
jgi:hypothetical protein